MNFDAGKIEAQKEIDRKDKEQMIVWINNSIAKRDLKELNIILDVCSDPRNYVGMYNALNGVGR